MFGDLFVGLPKRILFIVELAIYDFYMSAFLRLTRRFECRWSAVKINEETQRSDVWFRGMGGSVLGVWVAHGEGRFAMAEPHVLEKLQRNGQIAMQYVDDDAVPTEAYPMNPNGSPGELPKQYVSCCNHLC